MRTVHWPEDPGTLDDDVMNDAAAPWMNIGIKQGDVCVTQPVITVENQV